MDEERSAEGAGEGGGGGRGGGANRAEVALEEGSIHCQVIQPTEETFYYDTRLTRDGGD